MRLGIDFGTTRTVVSATIKGEYPIVSFDTGTGYRDYVPGMAAVRNGRLCYGWDAVDAMYQGAQGVVRSIKRVVGQLAPDDPVPVAGFDVSAVELVTGYMNYLHSMLTERAKVDVMEKGRRKRFRIKGDIQANVAVPANAGTPQRYITLEAFANAGFAVSGMVNEPTAAGIEFAHRKLRDLGGRSPKRYIVVYDLGGGTFDTSAISLEGQHYDLLGTEGIARLGGDDFDEVILRLVVDELGIDADDLDGPARIAALEACRTGKEQLSPGSRKLTVDLSRVAGKAPDLATWASKGRLQVALATADVYRCCEPLIERTMETVGELFAGLTRHGIDPDNNRELGGVYLVGGGAAFPPVARALRAQYKRKVQLALHPHAATAIGLSIAGNPRAEIRVREVMTRHFGVWREADNGSAKVFDRLLTKNTAVPEGQSYTVRRVYQPTHTVGALRFLECASLTQDGEPSGDMTPWLRVLFPYSPHLAERGDLSAVPVERSPAVSGERIAETYHYNGNGTIDVVIENVTRGYERRFVLGSMA